MKLLNLLIATGLFSIQLAKAQKAVKAYDKNGKIILEYSNKKTKTLRLEGENGLLTFSAELNCIFYRKTEKKSTVAGEEGVVSYDQYTVHCRWLKTGKDETLFTTCLDGEGGTKPDYAATEQYPNSNYCGLEKTLLSHDNKRLYFQTEGWAVCPAIHYYDIAQKKLFFYKAGWLEKETKEGVQVISTGVEKKGKNNMYETVRYVQACLYDAEGKLIKTLSEKKY